MGKKKGKGAKRPSLAELKFLNEYVINGGNGAAAYVAGFPGSKTWKPESRARRASALLKRDYIESKLRDLRGRVERKAERVFEITTDKVLQEMASIGFANMADFVKFTSDGDPYVALAGMSRSQAAAISEVVVEDFTEGRGDDARKVRRVRFKLHDKRAALKDIGQHLGIFKVPLDPTGQGNGGQPVLVPVSDDDAAL